MALRTVLVCLLSLGAASVAHADRKEDAAAAADRGDHAFVKKAFAEALTEYLASYDRYPKPFLLFKIAECQRNLGKDAEALATYKKYLGKVTHGADRKKAQAWATELQAKVDAAKPPEEAAPAPVPVPQASDVEAPATDERAVEERDRKAKLAAETTATSPKEDLVPPGVDQGPFPDPILLHEKPPPDPKPPLPLYKRWYLWVSVVGGTALTCGLGALIYYERPRFRSELPVGGPGAALTVRF
jgi:hypothetical protein